MTCFSLSHSCNEVTSFLSRLIKLEKYIWRSRDQIRVLVTQDQRNAMFTSVRSVPNSPLRMCITYHLRAR